LIDNARHSILPLRYDGRAAFERNVYIPDREAMGLPHSKSIRISGHFFCLKAMPIPVFPDTFEIGKLRDMEPLGKTSQGPNSILQITLDPTAIDECIIVTKNRNKIK